MNNKEKLLKFARLQANDLSRRELALRDQIKAGEREMKEYATEMSVDPNLKSLFEKTHVKVIDAAKALVDFSRYFVDQLK